jgi:hypothetical protein
VRGRKHDLEHFLNQHGIDICLLSGILVNPGQAFRVANYVSHRTNRLTARGGTVILVRRCIAHQSLPVSGLNHFEATAIQVILAGIQVKIIAA